MPNALHKVAYSARSYLIMKFSVVKLPYKMVSSKTNLKLSNHLDGMVVEDLVGCNVCTSRVHTSFLQ